LGTVAPSEQVAILASGFIIVLWYGINDFLYLLFAHIILMLLTHRNVMAGFLVPEPDIPKFWRWLYWADPARYGVEVSKHKMSLK
jgi:hypothetical protein